MNPSLVTGSRGPRVLGALAVSIAMAGCLLALSGLDPNVVCLLPALLVALPLAFRRYPGARTLTAIAGGISRRRVRLRSSVVPTLRVPALVPRGGLLLARSLAVRPPPPAGLAAI